MPDFTLRDSPSRGNRGLAADGGGRKLWKAGIAADGGEPSNGRLREA